MCAANIRATTAALATTVVLFSGLIVGPDVLAQSPAASDSPSGLVLSFTKWITITPGDPYMQGVVTGEGIANSPGPYNFAGQVLVRNGTQLGGNLGASCQAPLCGEVTQLEAVYEVESGEHSFRTYIQGAYDGLTNRARLDGYVLGGWLAGQPVHVEFQVNSCSEPNAAGGNCYYGTIAISPGPGGAAQQPTNSNALSAPAASSHVADRWYLEQP